jgi:hypothetical protein
MNPLKKLSYAICATTTLLLCHAAHAQTVTTFAGNNLLGGNGGDGQLATSLNTRLNAVRGVLARADGSVLIADSNNRTVRRVDLGGIINIFAGTGFPGYTGDTGLATSAAIGNPFSVAEDAAGNAYIGGVGYIRKVSAGTISGVSGTGTVGNTGINGSNASAALIGTVRGMAFDAAGNLFFTDSDAGLVRKIDSAGKIYTVAGTGVNGAFAFDNVGALSEPLSSPRGIVVATDGSLLVAVGGQNRVRKIIEGGNITTVAGSGAANSLGDGGQALAAGLVDVAGLALDGAGGFFAAQVSGGRVRKIAADGTISTLIGDGTAFNTGDNGPAAAAAINQPNALSRDRAGNLYVVSFVGRIVRKITFPDLTPRPSIFKAFVNTATPNLGTISPEGEQTVPYGGRVAVTVSAIPRHVLRVASNCDYVQTSRPMPFVPIGTGTDTFDVTVNGPCQMEATFTPLIPRANVNTEMAANALFTATERVQTYTAPTSISQTTSVVGKPVTFKAWVTDIAGVPYPSATNVITFKANGVAIAGCANVPLTLRASNVVHIREANCTTSFSPAGNVTITTEFAGDTYNFPAASSALNHSVTAPQ